MIAALAVLVASLILLVWSADRFVDGSSSVARHFSVPPLLIGMVVVGFGTSAPELLVSTMAAWQNTPGIALGNAYGSNITNIALILGVSALVAPITFRSRILRNELPILTAVTGLAASLLWDLELTRTDAWILLGTFVALMGWTVYQGIRHPEDNLGFEMMQELETRSPTLGRSVFWLLAGLLMLIASSRLLVWGAVKIARGFGVDDLIVGLTIVAVGTSLPELASSVIAARKKEHDIALGNVLGSNLFNTLAVVGIAGAIRPIPVAPEVVSRDFLVMGGLTLSLFVIGYGFRSPGRINRPEGALLLAVFLLYTAWLVLGTLR